MNLPKKKKKKKKKRKEKEKKWEGFSKCHLALSSSLIIMLFFFYLVNWLHGVQKELLFWTVNVRVKKGREL